MIPNGSEEDDDDEFLLGAVEKWAQGKEEYESVQG